MFGAICANINQDQYEKIKNFGLRIGIAYQIIDDLLDDSSATGKTLGKDKKQNKLSYLKLFTPKEAFQIAKDLSEEAFSLISNIGNKEAEKKLISYTMKLLERLK